MSVELYDAATGEFFSLRRHSIPLAAVAFTPAQPGSIGDLIAGAEVGELRSGGYMLAGNAMYGC
jgi:hypothetical protein